MQHKMLRTLHKKVIYSVIGWCRQCRKSFLAQLVSFCLCHMLCSICSVCLQGSFIWNINTHTHKFKRKTQIQTPNSNTNFFHHLLWSICFADLWRDGWKNLLCKQSITARPLITGKKMMTAGVCWHTCFWVLSCTAVIWEKVSHWGDNTSQMARFSLGGLTWCIGVGTEWKSVSPAKENIWWQIIVVEGEARIR